ncbi:hypothetical protein [Fluviicola chungangensis]|uniref:Uncharacterized protein n=1 Tax=Fluviicola chungangensis TaxID=2597671 RepID=A0A556MYD7_9FLAO|nr:hypothetical protein [Fluviicola chungangensis]TSJ44799.1 hypothetical protein FO442_09370 [Fluviicola chungangensis]
MKNFWRRLRLYGFGFGIGLIMVFFFFRNRGCAWLPENRVKNTFLGKVLVISETNQRIFDEHHLSDSLIVSFLDDGSIAFGSSKKQGKLKVYKIEKEVNGKNTELWFSMPEDAFIAEVVWPKGSIQKFKSTTEGFGRMIHFPNVKSFVYLKENDELKKQMAEFGIKGEETIQFLMKKSGLIDFSKSKLTAEPVPEQFVVLPREKGDTLSARTTWFKEHIEFYELERN